MSSGAFILVIFLATSESFRAGAAGISQEFNSETACWSAGRSLAADAKDETTMSLRGAVFKGFASVISKYFNSTKR